jgi:glucan 1,3-beta-glucosidase
MQMQQPLQFERHKPRKLGRKYCLAGAAILIAVAAAIAVPLVLTKRSRQASEAGQSPVKATSGHNGSVITMSDGSTFTYTNAFGGDWAADPADPFGPSGRAQYWSKRINEEWVWGKDIARGVNLGYIHRVSVYLSSRWAKSPKRGWLVTEPFITPALYEKWLANDKNINVVDEWTLILAMGDQAEVELDTHYSTFVTERDFADIAAAGLNWVRIPLPFWAIETRGDEPFLAGRCWKYFLKAIEWSRKYGIRIFLDLHTLPGSQNGWVRSEVFRLHQILLPLLVNPSPESFRKMYGASLS